MPNSLGRTMFGSQGHISGVGGAHTNFQSLNLGMLVSHLASFPLVAHQANSAPKHHHCTRQKSLLGPPTQRGEDPYPCWPSSRSFSLQRQRINWRNCTNKPLFQDTHEHYNPQSVWVADALTARASHTPPYHRATANTTVTHSTSHRESNRKHNANTCARE